MNSVTVHATRWELTLGDDVVTQAHDLAEAGQQVRDYLDTVDPSTDHSLWVVSVVTDGW
ncbi:hypothetical protein [Brachybacterium timonense]|uniref:hypothetical protein n=1 Tax=Brachybacterium timonense TaxID=2050896 RepID=UPI001482EAC7|nr:hypothetical protein [Brachybacterium timonense]